MSIMGGIFTHTMGVWKISAPLTINGKKAAYLAEVAAKRALQDANYRFFSMDASDAPDFPAGPTSATRGNPYVVLSNGTETAEYWIERPYKSSNTDVDTYLSVNRGLNDDDTTGVDDDDVDDDGDDHSKDADDKKRYTIIATGKVKRNGTTVAKKQVKVKASIVRSNNNTITPGVYTAGIIQGDGTVVSPDFDITKGSKKTSFAAGNDVNVSNPDSETNIVYRTPPEREPYRFKALSTSQGHNQSGTWSVPDDYPNGSFYYVGTMPNVTYVDGNLSITSGKTIYGVFYVTGWVDLISTAQVYGIIICDGNITLNAGPGDEMHGGIIQYGSTSILSGYGNKVDVHIDTGYFQALSRSLPDITVESWHETRSAN